MIGLFRVQDAEGRGPWRPGFSHRWIDPDKDDRLCPPLQIDFPDYAAVVSKAHRKGLHIGCAVRGARGIHAWFTPQELHRLTALGFRVADVSSANVLAESPYQVIIGSRFPLRMMPDARVAA